MDYFVGVDVGSLSTDVVILDPKAEVLSSALTLTGANSTEAAEKALSLAWARAGLLAGEAAYMVGTGYGRVAIPRAQQTVTEITCHAKGAHHLFPDCRTVIDIGGQDSKVIALSPQGKVVNFVMNDKCAAGTGRFLEVMAAKLGVALEEMGGLSCAALGEASISSVCTVFAESEIVSLVAKNHPTEEIIKGLHRSVVNRVLSMVRAVGTAGLVCMSGGVARNQGVVELFAESLGSPPAVPAEPQMVGALGAALLAREKAAAQA